jgi:LiaF transmembrane domain
MSKVRFKRFGIILLGAALIALGVVFFAFGNRTQALELLIRLWPVFLILAGAVRVAGFVLDREPRSPVGGMLVIAIGGILLAAGFRNEHGLLHIFGKYWFFLLLAFIGGRVIAEYGRVPDYGVKRRAFAGGTLAIALLLSAAGLGAHFVSRDSALSMKLQAPFEKLTGASSQLLRSEYSFETSLDGFPELSPESTLRVGDFPGDIVVRGITAPQPRATLVKRVSADSEEAGRQLADNIKMQVEMRGADVWLMPPSLPADQSLAVALVLELPEDAGSNLEFNRSRGTIKISGIEGSIKVSEPRRSVVLREIKGRVTVDRGTSSIELSNITGELNVRSTGSEPIRANDITGKSDLRAESGGIEVEDASGPVTIVAHRNVKVRRFDGPLDATSRQGTIELFLDDPPQFDIIARSEKSNARITLPAASIFRLNAISDGGRIRIRGFEHLELPQQEAQTSMSFDPGIPAPLISVRTRSGEISITSSGNALAKSDRRRE